MKIKALLVLSCLAGCSGAEEIGDPGFTVKGTVTTPQELDFAPVVIQAFGVEDLDPQGAVIAGRKPFWALSTSGPLSGASPLAFGDGRLGCAHSAGFRAWIDVDGDSALSGSGGWEYEAEPGPGDLVTASLVPHWQDTPLGGCASGAPFPIALTVDQVVFGVGDAKSHVVVELGSGAAPFNLPLTVSAYSPDSFPKGQPCGSCTPIATEAGLHLWNTGTTPLQVDLDLAAVPMRLWIEGAMNGDRYGALVEPTLFAGETGTRGRTAIGVPAVLKKL